MEARLVPVNGFIGMCTPDGLWPAPLWNAGFRLAGLEVPFRTTSGTGRLDGVAFNDEVNVVLAAECKSGGNVKPEQAKRLTELEPIDLIRGAGLTVRKRGDVTIDVVYVCLEDHLDRVIRGLHIAQVWLPIVVLGEFNIRHEGAPFHSVDLEAAFAQPIAVTAFAPRLIVVDEHSESAEFDDIVRAELVAVMSQRLPAITIPALAERAIPYLPMYGAASRGTLRRKVQEAARRVAQDMSAFLRFRPPDGAHNEPRVEVLQTPEDLDPRGRTQGWQAVARAAEGKVRRRPPPDTGTIPFDFGAMISELAAGEELEDDDSTEEETPT